MDGITANITALYAGILALLYMVLAIRVIGARRQAQVGLGTGDDPELLRRVRIHGNFAEYVPICLLLMLLLELGGVPAWQVHVAGVLLVAGRMSHAYALSLTSGASIGRVIGMTGAFLVLILGGLRAIALGLGV